MHDNSLLERDDNDPSRNGEQADNTFSPFHQDHAARVRAAIGEYLAAHGRRRPRARGMKGGAE